MRRAVIAGVSALVLAVASAAAAQSRTIEETVKLEPGGSLTLLATLGSVRLTAWDRNEVRIRARIEAGDWLSRDGEYAKQAVDAARVHISGGGDDVRIRSDYDNVPARRRGWGGSDRGLPEIHYEISAPRHIDLALDVDRSDSQIEGFSGRVSIEADRSELRVSRLAGDVRVEIDRGGRSRFEDIEGSFRLEGDRTDLDLSFAKLSERGTIELDRGDATIRVPRTHRLTLRTDIERRGSFRTDLPLDARAGSSRSPAGTINGGGPELTVIARRARVELRAM